MKKLGLFLSIILIVGSLITTLSFIYSKDTTIPDDENKVYWFQISLRINAKNKEYVVNHVEAKITEGDYDTFKKQLGQNMNRKHRHKNRRQLLIGPFQLKEEAQDAYVLYNVKDTLAYKKLPVSNLRPEEVYWFFFKIPGDLKRPSYITRTAARIGSGTPQDFVNVLTTGLGFEQLAIGPFWDYQKAEDSKAIYRSKE